MATRFKGPVDSVGGFKVNGTEVINSSGAIIGDIQATALSIGTAELANVSVTTGKIADDAVTTDKIDPSVIQTVKVTLTAASIVGTAVGDIGHADGALILANQGAGKFTEVLGIVVRYNFDTAAYTGGNNDMVVRSGASAITAAFTDTNLITAADSRTGHWPLLATPVVSSVVVDNNTINIKGTAFTNPGTAAGTLDVYLTYRVITL